MPYRAQAVDTTEPYADSTWEIVANQHLYGVISGCDVTPDSGDLTVDVAAGTILHNGSQVSVSEQLDAVTLVADPSNPRFSWVAVNSAGTVVLVSGDAAADPSVPELGDNVALSLIRIPASETFASNCTDIEKRILAHRPYTTTNVVKAADETVNNSTTLQDDDELAVALSENTKYWFEALIVYRSSAVADFISTFTVPSGATIFWQILDIQSGGSSARTDWVASSGGLVSSEGAASDRSQLIRGYVSNGANAGNLQLMWAQSTANASNTIVRAGAWLRVGEAS